MAAFADIAKLESCWKISGNKPQTGYSKITDVAYLKTRPGNATERFNVEGDASVIGEPWG